MIWTLKDVKKETEHKYLNFYMFDYQVKFDDGTVKNCPYCVTSRNETYDKLRAVEKDFKRADAVLIATYTEIESKYYFLLEKQFRQPLNREVYAFPAGLCDKEDKDIIESAKREVKEETGYDIEDCTLLTYPSPTSDGMSDECNATVLAKLSKKGLEHKETFEDIQAKLYSSDEALALLNDPNVVFSNASRITLMLMLSELCSVKYIKK